ncbi:MAG TPA: methylated-DNA--[protein]-cysteine S-methyltransferase [Acholeplasma sp.]|nr:methylated-DNA--[protein]-cysteine S-methyltransferase [Acholeplasma sp.]
MNKKYFSLKILNNDFLIITNNDKVISLDITNETSNLTKEDNLDFINNVEQELTNYLLGKSKELNFPYQLIGTNFQKSVWEILLKINYGETLNYEDIAVKLGDKNKVRAVGNAVGKNPILIKVPCHRVIRKNGELGGFSSGIDVKLKLHEIEGI